MNCESVATAKRPAASLALTAELAAASEPLLPLALLLLLSLLFREPNTPPTTAAIMMIIKAGMPNLIQLLVRFFGGDWGVMKPDCDSVY